MSARAKRRNGARRLAVEGDMTIYGAAALKARLMDALKGASQLEVDLSRVGEVDTAGVQLLLLLKREAARSSNVVRIVGHSPATLDAIDLFNLGATFGDPVVISKRADRRAQSAKGSKQ